MNIFLCGKGRGAQGVLEHILANPSHKVCVWSYPDADLLALAEARGIMRQTASVNDVAAWPFQPVLIVSVGYLDILSPAVLGKVDGINCHYALLPLHPGRSAVPWAIFEGDRATGITWHRMTEQPDRGNILMQAACPIGPADTQLSLFDKLHDLAAVTFPAALRLAWGGWDGWRQEHDDWNAFHRAGPPLGGVIGETWPPDTVERFIRAMTYPPLPPATFRGRPVWTMDDYLAILDDDSKESWY